MLAQSHNPLGLITFFTQPKKNPNLLPVHMESRKFVELILASIVLVLGILVLLACWFVYYITPPINEMSSYTVTSATVDPFNISSLQLTAAWNISIYIKNYGWLGDMYFDRVQSSIYYGSHLLSQDSIPCFFLESDRHKTLQDRLMAHSKSLDVDVAESMIRERLLRGAVDFRVELLAWTKYISCGSYRSRYGGYNDYVSNWMKFNISCENVTVGFPATHDVVPGLMLGPPRTCSVLVDGKTNNKGWN